MVGHLILKKSIMLIRKIKKGIYEVLLEDHTESQYRVEDMRTVGAMTTESVTPSQPWAVWELKHAKDPKENFWKLGPEVDHEAYTHIISEKTFKDCMFAIALWEEANEV